MPMTPLQSLRSRGVFLSVCSCPPAPLFLSPFFFPISNFPYAFLFEASVAEGDESASDGSDISAGRYPRGLRVRKASEGKGRNHQPVRLEGPRLWREGRLEASKAFEVQELHRREAEHPASQRGHLDRDAERLGQRKLVCGRAGFFKQI